MNTPRPLVARSGEDLLALLPILFGFQPQQSLVLVCVPPGPSMHARVDLGTTLEEVMEGLESLLVPARRHGAERAFLCVLGDLRETARWTRQITRACRESGLTVLEMLAADGRRWQPLGAPSPSRPYDVWSHPLVAQAVLDGRVILRSRQELADGLAAVPDLAAQVQEAALRHPVAPATAEQVRASVRRHARAATVPDPVEAATLLCSVADPRVCLTLVETTDRAEARRLLPVWTALLRSAPPELAPPVAGLLGFAAWLAGEGALAWCAVDRAGGASAGDLAGVVAQLLEGAVRPDVWDGIVPWSDAVSG